MRTPRGRVATPRAYLHFGLTPPDGDAQRGPQVVPQRGLELD